MHTHNHWSDHAFLITYLEQHLSNVCQGLGEGGRGRGAACVGTRGGDIWYTNQESRPKTERDIGCVGCRPDCHQVRLMIGCFMSCFNN